jgi:DNA-binding GntR family transcriptional regulator
MRAPFNASIPIYHQIAQLLLARARAGDFRDHGLPTEHSLCAEFGVSRTTIRQALAGLKSRNLLESRRGAGTRFVGAVTERHMADAVGDPLHAALNTQFRIVSVDYVPAREDVAALFAIRSNSPVCRILRVNSVKTAPVSLVVSYLPAALAPVLTKANLRRPLHEVIWKFCGLRQKRSLHRIRIARADQLVAGLLGVALTDPVLHVQSTVYLDDDRPIRWTDNYFHEEKYEYFASFDWSDPSAHVAGEVATRASSPNRSKHDMLEAL